MKRFSKGIGVLLLLIVLLANSMLPVTAEASGQLALAINDTAQYILKTVKDPQVGSVGGEWAVLGLARSGYAVDSKYYEDYYTTVEEYVKACKGVLHTKKYTEYSRVIVALSSIGKDPRNVAGYNLLTSLGDFDKTIWQGINGPIWALIALDSGNYPMPQNKEAKTQATRGMYVDEILRRQLPDGGFSLFGGIAGASEGDQKADPDITAMALQALAKYRNRADVKKVVQEALDCLSSVQGNQGGYASWGTSNSESCVQVIVALCELGIPLEDSRFVKNGYTLLDNLLTYYRQGQGFLHTSDGSGSNQMATEQAFYAMAAAARLQKGQNSLYRMEDAIQIPDAVTPAPKPGDGLPDKNKNVKAVALSIPNKSFDDISGHRSQSAIEALAAREIINGKNSTIFDPESTMTRAEFAAIVVRALGLPAKANQVFKDVPAGSWYAGYVGTAYDYGIITGSTATSFNPNGTITREAAAVMTARAAKLCGMDTGIAESAVRDILAQFIDYTGSSTWSRTALAFCYQEGILPEADLDIRPQAAIKRCEVADMIFILLKEANLL